MSGEKNTNTGVGGVREAIANSAAQERAWRLRLAARNGGKDPTSKDGKVPSQESLEKTHRDAFLQNHGDKNPKE